MTKPTIFVTRKIPQSLLEPYETDFHFTMWQEEATPVPKKVLYEQAKRADGIFCMLSDKLDRSFIEHASHLKIVANLAVGYDNIDIAAANEHGIIVTNTPDVLTETTADLTFALLMATARRLIEANTYLYEDRWKNWSPYLLAGTDIYQKTIGIVGMGRIGTAVARRARGFDMNVLYHNRSRNETAEIELGATFTSISDLLKKADFVVSLVPATEETRDLFDREAFSQMKQSAIFINVSRGAVVDEAALYDALKERTIRAAGLDVFKNEPIDSTHPFASLENVVLLPHIGSASVETRTKMIELCLENIKLVFQGEEPKTPVLL